MKKVISKIPKLRRQKKAEEREDTRITNETMAAHREEILGSARKYIYPLQHSKHRLVVISTTIFLIAVVVFFSYCVVALYKFKSTSSFLYNVTQVIPLPIARIGNDFVSYENYLFEISHYTHYYKTQQDLDFNSDAGKQQLAEFKKRALEKVINDAYIKELAAKNGVSVSEREVNDQIAILRSQNRLGASDKEFEAVLRDFWDWSTSDFKRSLRQQILAQKLVSKLDTGAHDRANVAHAALVSGKDFATLAREVSEEPASKVNGGEYGFLIDQTNRDISPVAVAAMFKLRPGEYSEPVDVGYGIEIVKNIELKDNKVRGAHIVFNFKDINEYLNDLKDQQKTRTYISL